MHGTVRGLLTLLGTLAMLAFLLAAWCAVRIVEAPLSLSRLTPYIEASLSQPDRGMAVQVNDTILAWSRKSRSLEIRALRVRIVRPNGALIAAFPEMSVQLSGAALLRGKLVPRSLRLSNPQLHLLRDQQGALNFGIGATAAPDSDPGDDLVNAGIEALLTRPGRESLSGQLQRIDVVDGAISIEDRLHGINWTVPHADLAFLRDDRGIALHARLDLMLDGQSGTLDANGLYLTEDRALDITLSATGLRPSTVATLAPSLEGLNALQFPIGGTLRLGYQLGRGLTALHADVAAGGGLLDLTALAGFSLPIKSMALKLDFQEGVVQLQALRVDLGGSILTADGHAENLDGDMTLTLHSQVDQVALDALPSLWPKTLAPNPRAWIAANLSRGRISDVDATLKGHLPAGQALRDLALDSLDGSMSVQDATVRTVVGLPLINHLQAAVTFDADHFILTLRDGESASLSLPTGQVILKGLSHSRQDAEISLVIDGGVADVLRFIDNPPLGWTSKMGFDPSTVGGQTHLTLGLDFPLVDSLTLDQLRIKVEADDRGLSLQHVVKSLDLTEGSVHLSIDNAGVDADGTAQIDHQPARLHWRQNFAAAAFRGRYEISSLLTEHGRALAGLDGAPFQPPIMTGPVAVEMTATDLAPGRWDIAVTADLSPTALVYAPINLVKPSGRPATATARLRLIDSQLDSLPEFRLWDPGRLDINGAVAFDAGAVRQIRLTDARWARSSLRGTVTFRPQDGGITVAAAGASFDARGLIDGRPSDPDTDKATPPPVPPPPRSHPASPPEVMPLTISGRFGALWLSDQGKLDNSAIDLVRDHRDWRSGRIAAEVGDHRDFRLEMTPGDQGHSHLAVTSSDAGAVFRALDIFDNIRGGGLALDGEFDDLDPARPLAGRLQVRDFHLARASVLARLLTIAGLTGILDLMSGQGIYFAGLDMPFSYVDGILMIKDGQASGSALGVTAKGSIDIDDDKVALEGTIVPAYAVNSALGDLPLIGGVFSAEKGGGVLALNFQMKGPMADPGFSVNPLSALAPGFLRGLFGLFDQDPAPNPKH